VSNRIVELKRRMNEAEKGARRAETDLQGWIWQLVWGARKRAYEAALERRNAKLCNDKLIAELGKGGK